MQTSRVSFALVVHVVVAAFSTTAATLTAGAVDSGCTRCTATAIEGYLQTLI